LIILFVLVGVLLVGGGVAGIIDGLPYLVLERGFTQVIVGTMAVTGGVLLLALSRVLAELRRVRTTLSNAMMAISVASISAEASAPAPAGAAALAAGAGLAAGVGAALIAAGTSGQPVDDTQTTPKPATDETDEPDLFAKPQASDDTADWQAVEAEAFKAEAFEIAAPAETSEPQDIPAREGADWPGDLDKSRAAIEPATDAAKDEAAAVAPTTAAEIEPDLDMPEQKPALLDTPVETLAEPERRAEPWLDWPEPDAAAAPGTVTAKASSDDEFGLLRESLASHLAGPEGATAPAAGDHGRRVGKLDEAEAWMGASSHRREPWFEKRDVPAEPETPTTFDSEEPPEPAPSLQPPPWPPQTREPAAIDLPSAEPWHGTEAREPEPAEPLHERFAEPDEDTIAKAEQADLPQALPIDDAAPASVPEPEPPAASNEGIIGAYQVGDAHFTIFADGSIQARTPDGDYSFASMDELKTYLASEKSRLGV